MASLHPRTLLAPIVCTAIVVLCFEAELTAVLPVHPFPVPITSQVAKFHRKVVRRLAVDKRAADSCVRGGKIINAQIKRIESFDTFGAVLESGGLTLGEEQGALWGHASPSHEVW